MNSPVGRRTACHNSLDLVQCHSGVQWNLSWSCALCQQNHCSFICAMQSFVHPGTQHAGLRCSRKPDVHISNRHCSHIPVACKSATQAPQSSGTKVHLVVLASSTRLPGAQCCALATRIWQQTRSVAAARSISAAAWAQQLKNK